MKNFLLALVCILYMWGCLVTASFVFDNKVKLSVPIKVGRVVIWPFMIETDAIINSSNTLISPTEDLK